MFIWLHLVVQANVSLQNDLHLTEDFPYIPPGFVDSEDSEGNIIPGNWRREVNYDSAGLRQLGRITRNRYTFHAGRSRDDFMAFFDSPPGRVPWQ